MISPMAMISRCDDIVHFGTMISKLRLGYGYFNLSYVIQSVSVGIKAKPHFATLDCHVATPLLLAMTNGKLT